jgi:hypothetical protein
MLVLVMLRKKYSLGSRRSFARRRNAMLDDGELTNQAKPLAKDAVVKKWAGDHVPALFDFGPKNIKRFEKLNRHLFFDDKALAMHIGSLKKTGIFNWAIEDARRCAAHINGLAKIVGRGVVGQGVSARYSYKLEIPIIVQGQNRNNAINTSLKVTLFVVRDDNDLNISQITF